MGSRANLIVGLAIASLVVLVAGVAVLVSGGGREEAGPSATPGPEITTVPPITTTVVVTPTGASPTVGPAQSPTPSGSPTPQATPAASPSPPPMAITGMRSWLSFAGLAALLLGAVLSLSLRRRPA